MDIVYILVWLVAIGLFMSSSVALGVWLYVKVSYWLVIHDKQMNLPPDVYVNYDPPKRTRRTKKAE